MIAQRHLDPSASSASASSRTSSGRASARPCSSTIVTARSTSCAVRGELALAEPEIVLEPDADIAAGEHGQRRIGQLVAADREGRKRPACRQVVDHRHEACRGRPARPRECPCRAAPAPGPRSGPARPAIWRAPDGRCRKSRSRGARRAPVICRGHRPQHGGRVGHDVVALAEIHRAAIERADFRQQLGDMRERARSRRPCRCRLATGGSGFSTMPSVRSPPMPAVRLITTSMPEARMRLDHFAIELRRRARPCRSRDRAHGYGRWPRRPWPPRSRRRRSAAA